MRLARSLSILSACLVAISGLAGHLNSAAAQAPEKRIALVVGNGAYAKSPLATAANDAGLIAQTLQAAGFDVIGARDLDGDTLRKSFRDFINKAEAAGPDTVAMVYLAGYGLQLGGDNYFVPVDSTINRDTDVPIEALRTGDYIRQLASLPLKAGIVVLDAARQQPFVNGQIASGLALVEADPHMLIAFNAAPGTVAPAEQGPYGVYAQSLAEMIRTGGLPLPEVFNRVRLARQRGEQGRAGAVGQPEGRWRPSRSSSARPMRPPRRRRIRPPPPAASRSANSACRTPMRRCWSATRCRPMRIFSPPIPTIPWRSG